MHSIIVFVAKYFFLVSLVVVAVYWLRASTKAKFSLAWQLIAGAAIALLLLTLAARLYYDPRPFVVAHIKPLIPHAADNGFPSDHALLTAFLGFTLLLYSRSVGLFLLLIALLVSWTRIEAHLHHSLDIVGSFVIAALSVAVVRGVALWWHARRHSRSLH